MMFEAKKNNTDHMGNTLCKALEKRGFKAQYAATAAEAKNAVAALISAGASVGIPGSVSVRQVGVIEELEAKGCQIIHHWYPNMTPEARKRALLDECLADWVITSANAVSMDGSIVNIDGTGNRVAAMSWAPGKIIYIIGTNKIAGDLESAMDRARTIASPPNAVRTGAKTPCTTLGYCTDCDSPWRICNIFTIIERCPLGRECHVVVVGEELGY